MIRRKNLIKSFVIDESRSRAKDNIRIPKDSVGDAKYVTGVVCVISGCQHER